MTRPGLARRRIPPIYPDPAYQRFWQVLSVIAYCAQFCPNCRAVRPCDPFTCSFTYVFREYAKERLGVLRRKTEAMQRWTGTATYAVRYGSHVKLDNPDKPEPDYPDKPEPD